MTNPSWHRRLDTSALTAVKKGLDAWMDSDDDGAMPFLEGLAAAGYQVTPMTEEQRAPIVAGQKETK
jgi:hypothetical protein